MKEISIKDILIKNIKYVTEELKFSLIDKDWGCKAAFCACPLGCTIIANDKRISEHWDENQKIVSEVLGVSSNWIINFINGFDGNQMIHELFEKYPPDEEAFNLGAEIRKEFSSIIIEE